MQTRFLRVSDFRSSWKVSPNCCSIDERRVAISKYVTLTRGDSHRDLASSDLGKPWLSFRETVTHLGVHVTFVVVVSLANCAPISRRFPRVSTQRATGILVAARATKNLASLARGRRKEERNRNHRIVCLVRQSARNRSREYVQEPRPFRVLGGFRYHEAKSRTELS